MNESTITISQPGEEASAFDRVDLAGVQLHNVNENACVKHVAGEASAGRGGWMITPNVDIIHRCATEPQMHQMVQEADLVVADGMPLIWASRLQGTPLPERVCGSNLILSLSETAARQGLSIFLLGGGQPETAERAAAALRQRYPRLRVAGTWFPEFGFESDERQIEQIEQAVGGARPDIIFVALGFPKAERLIRRIRPARPDAWWIGVGISFSFVCGEVKRAPLWMQRVGLEWVHRLIQEPRRLIGRYLGRDLPFAIRLLLGSAWRGIGGGGPGGRGTDNPGVKSGDA